MSTDVYKCLRTCTNVYKCLQMSTLQLFCNSDCATGSPTVNDDDNEVLVVSYIHGVMALMAAATMVVSTVVTTLAVTTAVMTTADETMVDVAAAAMTTAAATDGAMMSAVCPE